VLVSPRLGEQLARGLNAHTHGAAPARNTRRDSRPRGSGTDRSSRRARISAPSLREVDFSRRHRAAVCERRVRDARCRSTCAGAAGRSPGTSG
jgi:hypothetical protein